MLKVCIFLYPFVHQIDYNNSPIHEARNKKDRSKYRDHFRQLSVCVYEEQSNRNVNNNKQEKTNDPSPPAFYS